MYYETRPGDDELVLLYRAIQEKLAEENQDADGDGDNEEPSSKKPRKARRSEASILEEESELHGLSPSRSKRVSSMLSEFWRSLHDPRSPILSEPCQRWSTTHR